MRIPRRHVRIARKVFQNGADTPRSNHSYGIAAVELSPVPVEFGKSQQFTSYLPRTLLNGFASEKQRLRDVQSRVRLVELHAAPREQNVVNLIELYNGSSQGWVSPVTEDPMPR